MEAIQRPVLSVDARREPCLERGCSMSEVFPGLSEKIARWAFNGKFGRNFATAFDLQMWCFGCDIRREQGNLLLEYGFVRDRPEGTITGASHYTKKIDDEHSIHLWGFAVIVSSRVHGLCLRRYERIPLLAVAPQITPRAWRPHDLPHFLPPRTAADIERASRLLFIISDELTKYERFVQSRTITSYRASCLKQRRSRKALAGTPLWAAWSELHSKLGGCSYGAV